MNKSKLTDWQKKDATRYKVIATGKVIKAVNVAHGTYEDIKTGQRYMFDKIKHLGERRHMVQIGFHIWRIGLYLFAREYMKYNQYYIIPGVSVDAVTDRYVDVELKILCFGVGIRFIWIKRKNKR